MTTLSRQDMQSMLDTFRNRLADQVATKQDVQRMTDATRDRIISYMHDYLQQNQQQFIRQLDMRTKIYKDKFNMLESRIYALEQELKVSRQLMEQMALRQRNVVIPTVQQAVNTRETRELQPNNGTTQPVQNQQTSGYGYNYQAAT